MSLLETTVSVEQKSIFVMYVCMFWKHFHIYFRRLARSTLVLIPVFGVYYIVFTFPMDRLDDTTSFIMLFIEMFFNSYQVCHL